MADPVHVEEHTPSLFQHAPSVPDTGDGVERLVASHRYLCKRGARKFLRAGLERCDLEQVAAIGLIKASRRFDPSSQTPFEAYAWLTIVGELLHFVRDHERLVRVPRRLKTLEPSYLRARDACVARIGREPNDLELAREMGVVAATVAEIRLAAAAASIVSLEDSAARAVASETSLSVEDRLLVREAFAGLGIVERCVIVGVDLLGISQLELGRTLGLSARRVSRVRTSALRAMRRTWAS